MPQRDDPALIWDRPEPAEKPALAPLSRHKIVRTAIEVADAEGLTAGALRKAAAAARTAGPAQARADRLRAPRRRGPDRGVAAQGRRRTRRGPDAALRLLVDQGGTARPDG